MYKVQFVIVYLRTQCNAFPSQIKHSLSLSKKPKVTRFRVGVSVSQRAKKTPPKMEAEMGQKIEKTVRKILESSNMDDVTEFKIRKQASEELALDLSKPPYKAFVREVVQSFLEEQQQKQEQDEEEEEEEDDQQQDDGREYDDEGNLIICKLSEKRKVTIQDFRGKTLVSIREYFKKDGKELPTSKGISLTEEQWSVFKKNVPAIEKAIRKMDSR